MTVFLIVALAAAVWVAFINHRNLEATRTKLNAATSEIVALRQAHAEKTATRERDHKAKISELAGQISSLGAQLLGLETIIAQRKMQFPWLAEAIADFDELQAKRAADHLRNKSHPAVKSAEVVREYGQRRRDAVKEARIQHYRVAFYENMFPWIVDYAADDVPDSVIDLSGSVEETDDDPATKWLSKAEYDQLPTTEKYQKALDNWRRRKKSKWEIGLDYERYIGFLYETQGYDVLYTGATDGFEDMGRDIIAKKGGRFVVIQCKYWSSEKAIREKHIFQLFGTTMEYSFRFGEVGDISRPSLFKDAIQTIGVEAFLYTSTRLSDEAKVVAGKLGIGFFENALISDYPLVKCNIAARSGEKIYHLPFDQQYDRTKINTDQGEKFVYTVEEAEVMGFRRAWRWKGHETATTD